MMRIRYKYKIIEKYLKEKLISLISKGLKEHGIKKHTTLFFGDFCSGKSCFLHSLEGQEGKKSKCLTNFLGESPDWDWNKTDRLDDFQGGHGNIDIKYFDVLEKDGLEEVLNNETPHHYSEEDVILRIADSFGLVRGQNFLNDEFIQILNGRVIPGSEKGDLKITSKHNRNIVDSVVFFIPYNDRGDKKEWNGLKYIKEKFIKIVKKRGIPYILVVTKIDKYLREECGVKNLFQKESSYINSDDRIQVIRKEILNICPLSTIQFMISYNHEEVNGYFSPLIHGLGLEFSKLFLKNVINYKRKVRPDIIIPYLPGGGKKPNPVKNLEYIFVKDFEQNKKIITNKKNQKNLIEKMKYKQKNYNEPLGKFDLEKTDLSIVDVKFVKSYICNKMKVRFALVHNLSLSFLAFYNISYPNIGYIKVLLKKEAKDIYSKIKDKLPEYRFVKDEKQIEKIKNFDPSNTYLILQFGKNLEYSLKLIPEKLINIFGEIERNYYQKTLILNEVKKYENGLNEIRDYFNLKLKKRLEYLSPFLSCINLVKMKDIIIKPKTNNEGWIIMNEANGKDSQISVKFPNPVCISKIIFDVKDEDLKESFLIKVQPHINKNNPIEKKEINILISKDGKNEITIIFRETDIMTKQIYIQKVNNKKIEIKLKDIRINGRMLNNHINTI